MDRINVAVLFGGMAEEHAISIKSAKQLAKWMDETVFAPVFVYISRDGAWHLVESPESDPACGCDVLLSPDRNMRGLWIVEDGHLRTLPVDVVFPMLHGRYGEDGAIQGLLELAGMPYVGCPVQSSVLGMDKALAYLAVESAGIATPRHCLLRKGEAFKPCAWKFPMFVKPAGSGSSFGVSKVSGDCEMPAALRAAWAYDDRALIEEAIIGREVGCAVLYDGESMTVGEIDEIELSGGFFRIHQEKQPEQGSHNAVFHVPARITEPERAHILDAAARIVRALGLRGLARIDLFLQGDGSIVFNEVNTMPGFTSYSRYPRMMEAAGIPMAEVVKRLIHIALKTSR